MTIYNTWVYYYTKRENKNIRRQYTVHATKPSFNENISGSLVWIPFYARSWSLQMQSLLHTDHAWLSVNYQNAGTFMHTLGLTKFNDACVAYL